MPVVYLLKHVYEDNGFDNVKEIGLFTSKERAEVIAQKYREYEGFRDYPDGFSIMGYEINKTYWNHGFKRVGKKDLPESDVDIKQIYPARNLSKEDIERANKSIVNEKIELTVVYVVEHSYETEDDNDFAKTIGVYTSNELAESQVEKHKLLPGFKDYPNGFIISKYNEKMINLNYWEGGFFRYTY